jgi:dimethylhistidine N-methyltransferase
VSVLARVAVATAPASPEAASFAGDVIAGLRASPKRIPAKYFYDREGSRLFEEITRLPEYYPTRSEIKILRTHARDIVQLIPAGAAMVEFGSGACIKMRILLDAADKLLAYVPVDISADFLEQEAAGLRKARPSLSVYPVGADFTKPFTLPAAVKTLPHVGFFPGSTIGNFEPYEAAAFLRNAGQILGRGALLIVGVDLEKDPAVLHAAYNDAAGITEKFNRNLLVRINRELDGNFDLSKFEHHAFYNREQHRIEMHLASIKRQKVRVAGTAIDFRAGETIHTENSYKYSPQSLAALARGAGWNPVAMWTDAQNYFAVHALTFG